MGRLTDPLVSPIRPASAKVLGFGKFVHSIRGGGGRTFSHWSFSILIHEVLLKPKAWGFPLFSSAKRFEPQEFLRLKERPWKILEENFILHPAPPSVCERSLRWWRVQWGIVSHSTLLFLCMCVYIWGRCPTCFEMQVAVAELKTTAGHTRDTSVVDLRKRALSAVCGGGPSVA